MAYIPMVGILIGHHAFDLSILCSRREVNHLFLLILTILFCSGVGILIIFLENVKIPTLCPTPPPPSGLTLIGALSQQRCRPRMKSHAIYISYIAIPHAHAHSTGLASVPTVLVPQKYFIFSNSYSLKHQKFHKLTCC